MADSGKILVTGATGNVGSAVLGYLGNADVRALTHDESKARSLEGQGAEVVIGDLSNPETLGPALDAVDRVFLLTAVGPNQPTHAANLIKTAKESGNDPRIVRLSVMKASPDAPYRFARQHAEIEDELAASGLPYTILRPNFFMQNTMMAAEAVASEGNIYMAFGDGKVGMIDVRDIGEVAAKVLTEDGHEGETYTLTGPASISFYDVAADLSKVLGKEVNYVAISLEDSKEFMLNMGLSEWMAEAVNELAKTLGEGYGDFTTNDIEQLTGRPATPYEKFGSDFAEVFGSGNY